MRKFLESDGLLKNALHKYFLKETSIMIEVIKLVNKYCVSLIDKDKENILSLISAVKEYLKTEKEYAYIVRQSNWQDIINELNKRQDELVEKVIKPAIPTFEKNYNIMVERANENKPYYDRIIRESYIIDQYLGTLFNGSTSADDYIPKMCKEKKESEQTLFLQSMNNMRNNPNDDPSNQPITTISEEEENPVVNEDEYQLRDEKLLYPGKEFPSKNIESPQPKRRFSSIRNFFNCKGKNCSRVTPSISTIKSRPSESRHSESRPPSASGGRRRKTRKLRRKRRTQKRGKKARKGQTKRK